MVDNLNMQAQISADATAFVRAIDAAIAANLKFAQSSGMAGNQVDAIDRKLNSVRKTIAGSTNDTLAQEKALRKQERAWDAQNRIYEDYLRHQERATAGTRAQINEVGNLENNLIRARYALYDVATSYAAVSAATLGAVTATTLLSARYETAFTEIERTTLDSAGNVSAGIDDLREQFLDLSEVIPLSFEELTKIGSLGAQLGIAEDDLVSFTTTVAQFSKLSGVSAEQTALAFGRIGELLDVSADKYVNLGSAIAAVAVDSESTEAQIISLTREISAGAAGAGLTADQVVGLSSALASLGVAPERARGALSTYFGTLNRAVAEGGQSLQDFAAITGLTTSELERLVRSGEGGEVLQRFIAGLNDLDDVGATQALDRLGLAQLRVEDTFRRLGQNVDEVNKQLRIAEDAFNSGTFLGDAYAVVLDDVASQFQLLLNSIGRFLATAGLPFLEFLRVALPIAASFFNNLSDFAQEDYGQAIIGVVGALTLFVGVIAAVRSASALATASLFALRTASLALGEAGVTGGMRGMIAQLLGVEVGAKGGATAIAGLKAAALGLAKATGVIALLAYSFDVLLNKGAGLQSILSNLGFDPQFSQDIATLASSVTIFSFVSSAIRALNGDVDGMVQTVVSGGRVLGGFFDMFLDPVRNIRMEIEEMLSTADGLRQFGPAFDAVADAARIALGPLLSLVSGAEMLLANRDALLDRVGRSSAGKGSARGTRDTTADRGMKEATAAAREYEQSLQDVGSAAGGAGRQVRTLVDYANDLRGVFGRAFDIRFGSQLAVDDVADSWDTLAERIRDARIEIQQLTADRSIKEYFLSVAEAYGDELRAGVLRGEIAELNEKIADTQADASTELQGNSKAARQNRSVITGLLKNYQDYITALAEGGADQATLNAAVARSRMEFMNQARALGFADAELQPYVATFSDFATLISRIPRNITVTANADPAIQAFNEYAAAARNAAAAGSALANIPLGDSKGARQKALEARIIALEAWIKQLARSGNAAGAISAAEQIESIRRLLLSGNYATGGYTGRGGKYEPAGIVHRGEYVVPKEGVNQATGLPKPGYMNALGGQMPSSRGGSYAGGGMVTSNTLIVELGPKSLRAMQAGGQVGDIVVAVDSIEVARANARGQKQLAYRGEA